MSAPPRLYACSKSFSQLYPWSARYVLLSVISFLASSTSCLGRALTCALSTRLLFIPIMADSFRHFLTLYLLFIRH